METEGDICIEVHMRWEFCNIWLYGICVSYMALFDLWLVVTEA